MGTQSADALLQHLVDHGQIEVARAQLPSGLAAASGWMRGRLELTPTRDWEPGIYAPIVLRRSNRSDGPRAALIARVQERPLLGSELLLAGEDRYAAECYERVVGAVAVRRAHVFAPLRTGVEVVDCRSARAAFVLSRLLAKRGVVVREPIIVTGDVADPGTHFGSDLTIEPVGADTLSLKVTAALAVPRARVFVPGGQREGLPDGVSAVRSLRDLYSLVAGEELPPVTEAAAEVMVPRLKEVLASGNVTEEVAQRIAEAASEYYSCLMVEGTTDQRLLGMAVGVMAAGLSRSGRGELAEHELVTALSEGALQDPDVRCQLFNALAVVRADRGAHDRAVAAVAQWRAEVAANGRDANPTESHYMCGTEMLVRGQRALRESVVDAGLSARLGDYRRYSGCDEARAAYYDSLIHHVIGGDIDLDPALPSVLGASVVDRNAGPVTRPTIYVFGNRLMGLWRAAAYERLVAEYDAWLDNPGHAELAEHPTEGTWVLWQVVRALAASGRGNEARQRRAEAARLAAVTGSELAEARLAACDLVLALAAGRGEEAETLLAEIRGAYDASSEVARRVNSLLLEVAEWRTAAWRAALEEMLDRLL